MGIGKMNKYAHLLLSAVLLAGGVAEASVTSGGDIYGSFDFGFTHNGSTVTRPANVWVPDNVDTVRGMLLLCPGRGGNSSYWINGMKEQARSIGFGLIGWACTGGWVNGGDYQGATEQECATNIQGLLDNAARLSGQSEISNAPVAYYGFSKGGWIANTYAARVPERSLGFFSDKSSTWVTPVTQAAKDVPGTFVIGSQDTVVTPSWAWGGFNTWRIGQLANVALTVDWDRGHSMASTDMIFASLAEAIEERYPDGQLPSTEPGNPLQLQTVDPSGVYLSQASTLYKSQMTKIYNTAVAPESEYASYEQYASWFPNQTSALVNNSHKYVTSGNPISITADSYSIELGEQIKLQIALGLSGLSPDQTIVKIYLEDEEIDITESLLDDGLFEMFYRPTESGIRSFIVAMEFPVVSNIYSDYDVVYVQPIPEPGTIATLGLSGLALLRRRKQRTA